MFVSVATSVNLKNYLLENLNARIEFLEVNYKNNYKKINPQTDAVEIKGASRGRPFEIVYKKYLKQLTVNYNFNDRDNLTYLFKSLRSFMEGNPIGRYNYKDTSDNSIREVMVFDELNSDLTLTNLVKKEQNSEIKNLKLYDGRRKDAYKEGVYQCLLEDWCR